VHIPVPYYLHSRAILLPSSLLPRWTPPTIHPPPPPCEPCTHTHTHNPPVPCPWPECAASRRPALPLLSPSLPVEVEPIISHPIILRSIPSHPIPRDHPRARTVVQLADLAQSNRFGPPVHHNPASPVLCAVCYRSNDCQPPTRSLRLTTTPLLDRLLACATDHHRRHLTARSSSLSLLHSARLASVASYPACSI
jgi:hypothetical protein